MPSWSVLFVDLHLQGARLLSFRPFRPHNNQFVVWTEMSLSPSKKHGDSPTDSPLWHALTPHDCLSRVGGTNPDSGLTPAQAQKSKEKYGSNALVEGKSRSLLAVILPQFINWMSLILGAVLVLALVTEEYIEAAVCHQS